jgi:hypothetical protein
VSQSKRPTIEIKPKLLALGLSAIAAAALPTAAAGGAPPRAHAARTISVNDTGRLRLVGSSGNTLIEEGQSSGTLPGRVRARLTVSSNTVRATFTISLHGGSISGYGSAKLNVGRGVYASFGGSLNVSHGTGRYAHVSGSGGLYGTINRNTDDATVQVVGRLHV